MTTQNTNNAQQSSDSTGLLERIARDIIIAYAWVSGPAMSRQQRMEREVTEAIKMEKQLVSTAITLDH